MKLPDIVVFVVLKAVVVLVLGIVLALLAGSKLYTNPSETILVVMLPLLTPI